jgi:glutathione synthase/RimK-type ligase-like ATP-grasp enzyme
MVLIFSTPEDEHAAQVFQYLKDIGVEARFLDLAGFPRSLSLRMHYRQPKYRNFTIIDSDGICIDCNQVTAAWWRRPEPFSFPPEITNPHMRTFAYRESYHALTGLWSSLSTFWVNPPVHDEEAQHKTFQLTAAQEVGLSIPRTLVSNDPDEARRFIQESVRGVVFKIFASTERYWRETRVITVQEMEVLDSVRYAPVIFQEYVAAVCDLRVTIVGQAVFAAAIYADGATYPVDYRMNLRKARIEQFTLPLTVEQRLKALLKRLGLIYGAVDLRLTSDDHYIFLEVNPSGEWLFIENATGQPISRSLAHLLAGFG